MAWILLTNSDHVRDVETLRRTEGVRVAGPQGERESFPVSCDAWLADGDEPLPGVRVFEMDGSKTPGELALMLGDHSLVTGDLVRVHRAGQLTLLPAAKLADADAAAASARRLAAEVDPEAVLTCDGWPIFRGGGAALRELAESL